MPNKGTAKRRAPKGVLGRLIRPLFGFYPVLLPVPVACILFNAVVSSVPSIFMQNVIAAVEQSWQSGDWSAVSGRILGLVALLAVFYVLSLAAGVVYTQLMAVITQGSLEKMREKMFNGMQDLPIRYFDTHNHGDIMSYYTNDIDTLRQMISQSFPQTLISAITLLTVFGIMVYYSIWLALVVVAGVIIMFFVTRYVSGHSSRYFLKQQEAISADRGTALPSYVSARHVVRNQANFPTRAEAESAGAECLALYEKNKADHTYAAAWVRAIDDNNVASGKAASGPRADIQSADPYKASNYVDIREGKEYFPTRKELLAANYPEHYIVAFELWAQQAPADVKQKSDANRAAAQDTRWSEVVTLPSPDNPV